APTPASRSASSSATPATPVTTAAATPVATPAATSAATDDIWSQMAGIPDAPEPSLATLPNEAELLASLAVEKEKVVSEVKQLEEVALGRSPKTAAPLQAAVRPASAAKVSGASPPPPKATAKPVLPAPPPPPQRVAAPTAPPPAAPPRSPRQTAPQP